MVKLCGLRAAFFLGWEAELSSCLCGRNKLYGSIRLVVDVWDCGLEGGMSSDVVHGMRVGFFVSGFSMASDDIN
jgi:hypothetical protein